jgi:hypothetical protein
LPSAAAAAPDLKARQSDDDLRLELPATSLAATDLEALPREGASDEAVAAWVDRLIDARAPSGRLAMGDAHPRDRRVPWPHLASDTDPGLEAEVRQNPPIA